MRLLPVFALLSAVQAMDVLVAQRKVSWQAISRLMPRENECDNDVDPPYTCEKVCGPGNIPCAGDELCYNPDAGEMCCSDGSYCGEGTKCTDNGCCDKSSSLDECGAKQDTEFKPTTSIEPVTVTKTVSKDQPTTPAAGEETTTTMTTTATSTDSTATETGESPPSRTKSATNVGAIAGGVVGGVAVVAAFIIAAIWLFLRHKRRMAAANQGGDGEGDDNDNNNADNGASTKRPLMEYFKPRVSENPPVVAELPAATDGAAHHIDGEPVYEMEGGAGQNKDTYTPTTATTLSAAPPTTSAITSDSGVSPLTPSPR